VMPPVAADLPPIPENLMAAISSDTPPTANQPSGSAAPNLDMSAVTSTAPKKKFDGKRIATILGILVLVGGLGTGAFLVKQQQDIREKAAQCSNHCTAGSRQITNCYQAKDADGDISVCNAAHAQEILTCGNTSGSNTKQLCCPKAGGTWTTDLSKCSSFTSPSPSTGASPTPSTSINFMNKASCNIGYLYTHSFILDNTTDSHAYINRAQLEAYRPQGSTLRIINLQTNKLTSDQLAGLDLLFIGESANNGKAGGAKNSRELDSTEMQLIKTAYLSNGLNIIAASDNACGPKQSDCEEAAFTVRRVINAIVPNSDIVFDDQQTRVNETEKKSSSSTYPFLNNLKLYTKTTGYRSPGMVTTKNEAVCAGTVDVPGTSKKTCLLSFIPRSGTRGALWLDANSGVPTDEALKNGWLTKGPCTSQALQCLNVKVYDTSWNQLDSDDLSTLEAGDVIRMTVTGTATNGTINKARFRVNSGTAVETTSLKPNTTNEYYYDYTIPSGVTSFTVQAELHESTNDVWF